MPRDPLTTEIMSVFNGLDRWADEHGPNNTARALRDFLEERPTSDMTWLAHLVFNKHVEAVENTLLSDAALDGIIRQVGTGPVFAALVQTAGCLAADVVGRPGGLTNVQRAEIAQAMLLVFWYTQRCHRTGTLERVEENRRTAS